MVISDPIVYINVVLVYNIVDVVMVGAISPTVNVGALTIFRYPW